jgi:bifunctional UDP-N-acetylglucosamine pyrophosphorylase / glucosamine-1-phosphate N-acetyltransferase
MNLAAIIMAAGMGTRMKSELPKVLHPLLDKPLLGYVLEAVQALQPVQTVVVVGHQAEQITAQFEAQSLSFAIQVPQLGTGHAVQQAHLLLENNIDLVLVVPADLPLLTAPTFQKLVEACRSGDTPLAMLTVESEDPRGFGRIVRDEQGNVLAIVEEAACTPEQKAIRELNVGAYVFNAAWLWENLPKVPLSAKGEYYLTDLIDIAVKQSQKVRAEILEDPVESVGINTRVHLAEAERALRLRLNRQWQEAGVTIIEPSTTYIGADVTLGQDTVIYPNTYLYGQTSVGKDCVIGPNTFVVDSQIGNACEIRFSVVEQAVLEDHVDAGPFAHLRKGAHLAQGVHMGNFGEIKNAYLGPGTKMGHFSYLGDATLGANVNVGAGTITCNYDGVHKHPTKIGDNTFIGSDTMLVAPLNIGKNVKTGAGAVVTHDIPDNSLAYGVPARTRPPMADPPPVPEEGTAGE